MVVFIRFNEWVDFYEYNLVPEWMSEKQTDVCLNCSYRMVSLQLEMARIYSKKSNSNPEDYFLTSFKYAKPACRKKVCLVDKLNLRRDKETLLNSNQLNNTKKGANRRTPNCRIKGQK